MCKAIDYTQKIISLLEDATREKERLYNLVHYCDLKTCDLLHQIELNKIGGMYKAYLTIEELKEVRKTRREAKDEIETLDLIENFKNSQEKKYRNILDTITLKQKSLICRHYNPKSDCKLTNFIKIV